MLIIQLNNMNFQTQINNVKKSLSRRSKFYNQKLKDINHWTSNKSEMNGTSTTKIRNILSSSLIELGISNEKTNVVLLGFYKNLNEFDASSFISRVNINSRGLYKNEKILDIFNKNPEISHASIVALMKVFYENTTRFGILNLNTNQIAGLCVFSQCVFMGVRSDITGFGSAEDLVELSKNTQRKRLNEIEKENARKRGKESENLNFKRYLRSLKNGSESEEEDDYEVKTEKSEKNENILEDNKELDDWESLL